MLRIHVLRRGGHDYYVGDLVPGRAEGTLLSGEPPGVWSGRSAAELGLRGTVCAPDFAQLLEGRHPSSGRALRVERARGTAGFDLTFCAPKSVSVLHLLASAEIAAAVGKGHVAAVTDAADYLERAAAGVRRMRAGRQVPLGAAGLASASFVHRTSRALDPHLHTHVVVANVVQGVDGLWSTLDSRRLFRHGPAAQGVYHARLRHELTSRLGVAWCLHPSGMGDVVGVDPTLCRLFSGRSADVDEHVYRRSAAPSPGRPASRAIAALVTRPPKDRSRTVDDLAGEWRARALEWGFPPSELTRVVGLGRTGATTTIAETGLETPLDRARVPTVDMGMDPDRLGKALQELAGSDRSLARRDIVAQVAAACPTGASAGALEAIADRLVEGSPSASSADRWRARDLAQSVERWRGRTEVSVGRHFAVVRSRSMSRDIDRRMEPPLRPTRAPGLDGRDLTR